MCRIRFSSACRVKASARHARRGPSGARPLDCRQAAVRRDNLREGEPASSAEAFALQAQRSFSMFSHKFNDGQTVHAKRNPWAALAGAYEIVCRLPMSGGDNQYWVRSLENGDRRVVRQSDLVVESLSDGDRPPVRRIKDTATTNKAVPARRRQAARTAANDQSSYEAAISEGWPVSPHWQRERGTAPGQREPPPATAPPEG